MTTVGDALTVQLEYFDHALGQKGSNLDNSLGQ